VEPVDAPTVFAVDPGGTTGWSVISVHPEALLRPDIPILKNIEHWGHGQLTGPENEQCAEILGLIDSWPGCCVLFEDFIVRSAMPGREVLSPVRITAKVQFGLYLAATEVPFFTQLPSEAMNVATDKRLKEWGFYQREGGLGHARDADRHALTWLRKAKSKGWMRAQCWPHLYGVDGVYGGSVTEVEPDEDEEIS